MLHQELEDIIPGFLEQEGYTGEDTVIVKALIMFQFEKLKKEQKEINHENLIIPYLGGFFAKAWTIKRTITTLGNKMKNSTKNFKDGPGYTVLREEKMFLERVYEKQVKRWNTNAEKIERRESKKNKDNELNRDTETGLGEQD